jgi:cytoplasmic iron level regulating protein YaaA (DUF328/UPF0246 family)
MILPPSETKRDGGEGDAALDLARLSHPRLTPQRKTVLAALRRLSRNLTTMSDALKLGPSQRFELLRNRAITTSPTMPALLRYTGVLFDALESDSLSEADFEFAKNHVAIHSALFGLVGGGDPIPAYRLSHDSRLPGVSLKKAWRVPVATAIAEHGGLVLDLRSEAYVELGPAVGASYLRVVAEGTDGRRRALNHFNKRGKGEFARAVIRSGIDHTTVGSLIEWAESEAIPLSILPNGELQLVVPEIVASRS